jgi:hypothetical protein
VAEVEEETADVEIVSLEEADEDATKTGKSDDIPDIDDDDDVDIEDDDDDTFLADDDDDDDDVSDIIGVNDDDDDHIESIAAAAIRDQPGPETATGLIFRLDLVRLGKYEAAPARRQTRWVLAKGTELVLDPLRPGAIAQLGERLHGMQEVSGSIPLGSTNLLHLVKRSCRISASCIEILTRFC